MQADEVIETYLDDTVRLLPRRQRGDVANELRALLNEELHARAAGSGRAADGSLALSLVRDYGRPNEVATRYRGGPPLTLIDPSDTWNFLRASIIGICAIGLLSVLKTSVLKKQLPPNSGDADDMVSLVILAWIGFLAVVFGVKSRVRQTWPSTAVWKPRDRNHVNRIGSAICVLLASPVLVLYAAPAWILNRLTGGRLDTSWATYTADFQHVGLPLFIGLEVALLGLLAYAAICGRWSRRRRRISIGLNLTLACLVLTLAVNGNMFPSDRVDQIARSVMAAVALFYVPGVGAQIYNEMGRIGRAPVAKTA
jgi:hypothetical protein